MAGGGRAAPRGGAGEAEEGSNNRFLARAAVSPSAIQVAETCHKIPALLPLWTRCGKPACRCTGGAPHGPYWVLRWREGSHHRRRYVRATEVETVRRVIERRRWERAMQRAAFADDLALLRRLDRLRRALDAALAADGGDR